MQTNDKMTLDLIDLALAQIEMWPTEDDFCIFMSPDQMFDLSVGGGRLARFRRKYLWLTFEETKIAIKIYSPITKQNEETDND